MSRGQYGYVYLTLNDRRRMAETLGLELRTFTRRYCEKTDGLFHLKNPDKDCAFLEGKGCGVYAGRPTQCRTWPFWPENMNARAWKKEVTAFCPGVGKGPLVSAAEIRALVSEDPVTAPSNPRRDRR